jgi:hypothetical protein
MAIKVSQKVLDGIETIRVGGLTNMCNSYEVQRLCFKQHYYDTVLWIEDNRKLYAFGIFQGFKVEEKSDECVKTT